METWTIRAPDSRRRLGEVARAVGIDAERGLGLGLRRIHLGVGRGIDDDGRPQLGHDGTDGRGISDIQRRLVDGRELDAGGNPPHKRGAQLSGVPDEQNFHG